MSFIGERKNRSSYTGNWPAWTTSRTMGSNSLLPIIISGQEVKNLRQKIRKVVAEQPILVYSSKTKFFKTISRHGGQHPIVKMAQKYGKDWAKTAVRMPAWMEVRIETKVDFELMPDHLDKIKKEIYRIIRTLPEEFRPFYQAIVSVLEDPDEVMDVPRIIEYLTMVSCRYVLDCIRLVSNQLASVGFQGYTEPSRRVGDWFVSRVWIFHDYQYNDIDYLLNECLNLSVKFLKMLAIDQKKMDLLKILDIKCKSSDLLPKGIVASKSAERKRHICFHKLVKLLKTMSNHIFFLFNTS